MSLPNPSPQERAAEILRFARGQLGPASEQILSSADTQIPVLSRIRGGAELEDAVLAELFSTAQSDRRVADEFLAYFLSDLLRGGHRSVSSRLRRFLDTGDLVDSVLGDVWADLVALKFETRTQFLSLLTQRVRWKASDEARKSTRMRRREDLRASIPPEEMDLADPARSPLSQLGSAEDLDRAILVLMRLPERDRELLRLFMREEPLEVIARETGLRKETARKALQRAIRKARRLLA